MYLCCKNRHFFTPVLTCSSKNRSVIYQSRKNRHFFTPVLTCSSKNRSVIYQSRKNRHFFFICRRTTHYSSYFPIQSYTVHRSNHSTCAAHTHSTRTAHAQHTHSTAHAHAQHTRTRTRTQDTHATHVYHSDRSGCAARAAIASDARIS